MTDKPTTSNALTTTADGFDIAAADPSASPIQGIGKRFKDGNYFAYGEKTDEKGRTYAVVDRVAGWQKLEKGCPPAYVMQMPGEPRPLQPSVPMSEWPLNFNGDKEHPWKWCAYLYLLDTATGEASTFWSNTTGGWVAVDELTKQITAMRRMEPSAIPVVALNACDMPTRFGGTTPRPHFKIAGWRTRKGGGQQLLPGPVQDVGPPGVEIQKPTLKEELNDALPF